MARSTVWVSLAVMLGMTCAVENAGAEGPPARVGIRLSHNVEPPRWVVALARSIVARVFARAGVAVVWTEQPEGAIPDLELTVILTAQPPVNVGAKRDVLALAIGAESGSGRVAYVVWPRVASFAHAKRVQVANVLGRVIAHEVGHLLLGHNSHSPQGIMRAHWNRADFASIDNHAVFTAEQSAVIRERITSVSRVATTR